MGIPQFHNEGPDQAGGSASLTVNFTGFTWSAGDILELVIATDGWVPVLATANGFALAADPQGNTASQTTNGGVAGTADCGIFVFWKRAVGSTTAADPEPTFQAPSVQSGTSWCLQPNSFSGARTIGTPYHSITKSIVSTATTAVTSTAASSTLANCLFMPRVASANDDTAFNNWTMTGSAGPSGTGAPGTGWHNNNGNSCSFTGDEGGFAAATANVTATTTFAATTKQALITLVMASVNEFELDEGSAPLVLTPRPVVTPVWPQAGDEIAVTASAILDEDAAPLLQLVAAARAVAWVPPDDEIPGTAASGPPDEDGQLAAAMAVPAAPVLRLVADDELPVAVATLVDEDGLAARWLVPPPVALPRPVADDEIPGITQPTGFDEESGLLSRLSPPLPAPVFVLVAADELPATTTSGIGGAGDMQRSLSQPNQTGTLTTVAPVPAWTTSLAVVADPSQGGTNRVTNGGNLYQARQNGTTASSGGGPTGTGTAINDGTTQWYFVGPAQGTNTTAGSQILCSVMRGTQSEAASIDPTDNDSGAYTVITNNAYANFTASFAGVWRRNAAANTKTNFQTSGVWGGSGGAGDEMSICWVELQGVSVGAPHTFSQVERLSATGGLGGTVTAAAITTTVPCIIVSFWFGNGNVQSTGVPDAATPAGGLTLIAGCTGPLSLTPNGYIQHMVAWRRQTTPGTSSEVWTASPTDEGAQLVTVAFQDLSSPSIGVDDDGATMASVRASVWTPVQWVAPADELPVAAALDDDGASQVRISAPVVGLTAVIAGDELAVTPGDDDPQLVVQMMPVAVPSVALRTDDEMPPVAVADEDTPLPLLAAPLAVPTVQRTDAEELPVTLASVVDEDGLLAPVVTPSPPPPVARADSDELPVAVVSAIVDEDGQLSVLPHRLAPPLTFPVQIDEFILAAAAQLDEDSQIALLLSAAAAPLAYPPAADEVLPTALDDNSPPYPPLAAPPTFTLRLIPEDEFQGVFVPPPVAMIDEDGQLPPPPLAPPPPLWQLLAVDELSIPLSIPSLPKHVRILSATGPAVVIANNAPTIVIVKVLNE